MLPHVSSDASTHKRPLRSPARRHSLHPVPSPPPAAAGLPSPVSTASTLAVSDGCPAAPSSTGRARAFTVHAVSSALHAGRRGPRTLKDLASSTPDVSRMRSSSSSSFSTPFGPDSQSPKHDAFDAVVNSTATVKVSLTPTRLRTLETRSRASSSPPPIPTLQYQLEPTAKRTSLETRTPTLKRNSASSALRRRSQASTRDNILSLPGLRVHSPDETTDASSVDPRETRADPQKSGPWQPWELLPPSVQQEGLAWEKAVHLDIPLSSSSSLTQSDALCSSVHDGQHMEVLSSPLPGKQDIKAEEMDLESMSESMSITEDLNIASFSDGDEWNMPSTEVPELDEDLWLSAARWEQVANAVSDSTAPSSPFFCECERSPSPQSTQARQSNDHTLTWDDEMTVHDSTDARSLLSSLLASMEPLSTADECRAMLQSTLSTLHDEPKHDDPRWSPHLERTLHRSKLRLIHRVDAHDSNFPVIRLSGGLRALSRSQAASAVAPHSVGVRSLA